MAGVADEQDVAAGLNHSLRLPVHLADQRAGCVDIVEPARLGSGRHQLGYAVGRKHHRPPIGHFVQFLDEYRAEAAQPVDDKPVVDDFMADVDRRSMPVDRQLNDLDRPVDAGAETARRGN